MIITFSCRKCDCGIGVTPHRESLKALCVDCGKEVPLSFDECHEQGILQKCPLCLGHKFYKQKDFNRKLGVLLFIGAAILSFWTYGLSLVALYLLDFFLFQKLKDIAICYHCHCVFRDVTNLSEIKPFDHGVAEGAQKRDFSKLENS